MMNTKIIFAMILVLMLMMPLALATTDLYKETAGTGTPAEFPNTLTVIKGQLDVSKELLPQKSFWEKLFSGQPFEFTDISSDAIGQQCTLKKTSSVKHWDDTMFTYSGGDCAIDDLITYKVVSGTRNGNNIAGSYIFGQSWLRKATYDLPNFLNYYIREQVQTLEYSYACYSCSTPIIDDFEKGCLSTDKTECVGKSDSNCDIVYNYEKECLQHTTENVLNTLNCNLDPNSPYCTSTTGGDIGTVLESEVVNIELFNIDINGGEDVIAGQLYTIEGDAKITGSCKGCVIETGINYAPYTQALSLVSESKGACGDDQTVGVKFDASNEIVHFVLKEKANVKAGKYVVDMGAYNGCYLELQALGQSSITLDIISNPIVVVDSVSAVSDGDCWQCLDGKPISGLLDVEACGLSGSSLDKTKLDCVKTPTTIIPTTPPTCVGCDDDNVDGDNEVTCYYCKDNKVVSGTATGSCGQGLTNNAKLDCSGKTTTITGTTTGVISKVRALTVSEIIGEGNAKYFDYKNEPLMAYGLTGAIILILVLGGYLLFGNKKKAKVF